jgi:NADH dehydrogenase (ubiquinone) 1 alpha/beta subcomplex 1
MHDDAEFRAGIRRELRSIRRDKLPPVWNDDSHFRHELGLDSLDLVEMVARLEQATGIYVPDEDVPRLVSISATVEYVRARRGAPPDEADEVRAVPQDEEASP